MSFSDNLIAGVVTLLVSLSLIFLLIIKWKHQYWKRQGIPYLKPSIPFGNFESSLRGKEHIALTLKRIYSEMKTRGWKYGGVYTFTKPELVPIDLDLIRNIMTKHFDHFVDRDTFYNEKDPLQGHLLNLSGTKWRNMRAKLTPTFTSGKMKMMFGIMNECQMNLCKKMEEEISKKTPIDIKEILACFTTNIIGSCAFGLEFKALEDENSAFRQMGRKMFLLTKWQIYKRIFAHTFPQLAKLINLRLSRGEISNFVLGMVKDTIDYREKNNYTRNDFMQLLIELKNASADKALTLDEIGAQCIVFFAAGFETSSTLMTFALYELAKNQDVQDRLRSEVLAVLAKHDNKFSYDVMQEMTYLNQVIEETLRMHPPAALLNRKCVKDYQLPNDEAIIKKGTKVSISVLAVHYDEENYPNPEKFDPERFSDENKKHRHNYAHLPFGEGPRNCIGMRFGLLQSTVGLAALIKDFKFTVNTKTREPLEYITKSIVLSAKGDIWLNAEKVSKSE